MRVAVVVGHFPVLSETFILNQITGLIDRGHSVDILAVRPNLFGLKELSKRLFSFGRADVPAKVHADVYQYGLMDVTYAAAHVPFNRYARFLTDLWLFITNAPKNPAALLRTLKYFSYRGHPGSVYGPETGLGYSAIPLLPCREPYDVIHCHFGLESIRAMLLKEAGLLQGPLLTSFHGIDIYQYPRLYGADIYDRLFQESVLCTGVSEHMLEELARLGCPREKLVKLHSGIDLSRHAFRERRRLPGEPTRLLTVARLTTKKGIQYAIEAVAKVLPKHPALQYTIVGEGYLRPALEQLVARLGLSGHVTFVGEKTQEEVVQLYAAAHLFVLPSITTDDGDREGIPNSLKEASAQGLPVLSTYHSGVPELVQDGASGYMVPERDVEALSGRLDYLIEHPEVWPAMGRAGRACVEERFDIEALNDQLVALCRRVAGQGVPAKAPYEQYA